MYNDSHKGDLVPFRRTVTAVLTRNNKNTKISVTVSRDLNSVFPGVVKCVAIRQFDVRGMREQLRRHRKAPHGATRIKVVGVGLARCQVVTWPWHE